MPYMDTIFKTIPKIAYALSDGHFLECVRIVCALEFFIFTRKLQMKKNDFKFSYTQNGVRTTLFLEKPIDIAVLKELYVLREYEWFPIENPKIIIDLGAHFGDTTLYYHARFPEARIIAVEPSPKSFERLKKHVMNIPNIIPLNVAVGGYDGDVTFNITESSLGNSVVARDNVTHSITVQQMTLDTLLRTYNIERADVIKFDIEGGEFSLFLDNPKKYARAYIGEVHGDLIDSPTDVFFDKFENFQYKKIPLSNKKRCIIQALASE